MSSDSVGMHRRAREHDPEQEQHDHRADVDEHLHPGDELLAEQDELRGAAREHDDEEQRGVHDVLASRTTPIAPIAIAAAMIPKATFSR